MLHLAATALYNSKALPCMAFLAQLFVAPPVEVLEKRLLTKILKFPFTALRIGDLFSLGRWGGCAPRSLLCSSAAALVRSWDSAARASRWLEKGSKDELFELNFERLWKGQPWGQHWDIEALFHTLRRAAKGEIAKSLAASSSFASSAAVVAARLGSTLTWSPNTVALLVAALPRALKATRGRRGDSLQQITAQEI